MTQTQNNDFDLTTSRIIKAPRALVWSAWADPVSFAQWWIPAPIKCKVVAMDLRPGGSFVTEMSENGGPFMPHLTACFLNIAEAERIVFTNALVDGWRPAAAFYPTPLTATITSRTIPRVRNTSPMSCTRTAPTATGMRNWGSMTAGARSPPNWRRLSSRARRSDKRYLDEYRWRSRSECSLAGENSSQPDRKLSIGERLGTSTRTVASIWLPHHSATAKQ